MKFDDILEALGIPRDDAPSRQLAAASPRPVGAVSRSRPAPFPVGAISRSRPASAGEDRDREIAPTAAGGGTAGGGTAGGIPPADWINLAAAIARTLMPVSLAPAVPVRLWPRWDEVDRPLVLGIAGGQGSGKSTLARQLERALTAAGARTAACSLDDFYLSRARRAELADDVHPLLATRGVPGTHDVAALAAVIDDLGRPGTVALPGFDKGADDPLPPQRWRRVGAPLDVLVLEGWCVGARPQPDAALREPVNELERREDPDGRWRRFVNDALAGPYAALWARLHGLVYLRVPDLAAVRRWRTEQEQALPADRRMDTAAIERFVAHYERLTLDMLAHPDQAALVARLDAAHALAAIHRNRPA